MTVRDDSFVASQRCRQPAIWAIALAVAAYTWFSVFTQVIGGEPMGSRPAPDIILILIWLLFGVLFPLAIWKSRLTIRMDREKLYYRFFPFHLKEHYYRIRLIDHVEPVQIRPVMHFGGWGIRYGMKGKGYILSGRKAVRLDFRWSARPVFITCDNPREVADAFEQRKRSFTQNSLAG